MSLSARSLGRGVERHLRGSKCTFTLTEDANETIVLNITMPEKPNFQWTFILIGKSTPGANQTVTINRQRGKRILGVTGWDGFVDVEEQCLWVHYERLSIVEALRKYYEELV